MKFNARYLPLLLVVTFAMTVGFASTIKARPTAVAVVDWLKMTENLDEWKEIKVRLEDKRAAARKELEDLQAQIETKEDELEIVKGTPQFDSLEEEIRGMIAQWQFKGKQATERLEKERLMEQLKIYQKISASVGAVAERDGWDIVIWKDDVSKEVDLDRLEESAQLISQRHVFYANESVDITSEIVQYMNNQFHSGEKQ